MSQLEYLIALLSIIVGLALTNMARSLRELVRPDRSVRWHWLPLVWSASLFLIIIQLWWNAFGVLSGTAFSEALAFVPYLGVFLLLYLTCSFALPSPDQENGLAFGPRSAEENPRSSHVEAPGMETGPEEKVLDLKAFYFSVAHRRWFFGTLALMSGTIGAYSAGLYLYYGGAGYLPLLTGAGKTLAANLIPAGLAVVLSISDRWWVHAAGGVLTLLAMVAVLALGVSPLR